jgi:hypothetical protein
LSFREREITDGGVARFRPPVRPQQKLKRRKKRRVTP